TSNWIIRHCYFHDIDGRMMLYAGNGTLEHNRFERGPGYFHIGTSVASFEASGQGARNLVVRHNLCYSMTADTGVWGGETNYPIFQDILFAGNSFINASGRPLTLSAAEGVTIRDNYFENCNTRPSGGHGVIELAKSARVW